MGLLQEVVGANPEGLQAAVAEGGDNWSMGQRQVGPSMSSLSPGMILCTPTLTPHSLYPLQCYPRS